jgi:DNA (cytosine-5)-methyltransferase 1
LERLTVASFFAGIGGFDLGFERAGFKTVFQCEVDPHCQQVLRRHWPDVKRHDDIKTLDSSAIPLADVWTAGWPCQDLSNGNIRRSGLSGERSGLFFRFMDIVRQCSPRWIVLENVQGLLSAERGEALEVVVDELEKSGYLGGWTSTNVLDFGIPQNRERIIFIASHRSDCAHKIILDGCKLRRDSEARVREREDSESAFYRSPESEHPVVVQRRGGFGFTKGSSVCPTIRAQSGKHQGGHSDRPILIGEKFDLGRVREVDGVSKRMDGRRGRLIGNAIAVPVAQWIAEQILKAESHE